MELLSGDNDNEITSHTRTSNSKVSSDIDVLSSGGKAGEYNKVGTVNTGNANNSEASSLVTILQAQRDRYKDRLGNV